MSKRKLVVEVKEAPKTRAALYLRVSTDEQATEGYGLDVQRTQCEAYATAFGLQVVTVFVDDGISGTKDIDGRPALAKAVEAAKADEYDFLITAALDRIARKALLLLKLWDNFEELGINIVCVKERIDTSTAVGRLMRTVIAAIAEFERDTIIARTTAGRDERGRRDGERGGRLPMGYVRLEGDTIGLDPERAEMVRTIFDYRRRKLPLRGIAHMLNVGGLTTPRGHRWHASSIKAVLDNERVYRGGKRGDSPVRWIKIL